MMHSIVRLILVLFCVLTGVGLTNVEARSYNSSYQASDASTNKFGIRLLKKATQKQKDNNVLISPLSIDLALKMAYNGAYGQTKVDMANVLCLKPTQSLLSINKSSQSLIERLSQNDKVKLRIANGMFPFAGCKFSDKFTSDIKNFYKAEVGALDLDVINNWVKKKTNGMIPRILDELTPDDRLALVNAVYFKGDWLSQFDARQTRDQPFYFASGSSKNVAIMQRRAKFQYLKGADFQAVKLPYKDRQTEAIIILPDKSTNLAAFQSKLTSKEFDSWTNRFTEQKGHLGLPKFKVEYKIDLIPSLKSLGMGRAFDENRANLSLLESSKGISGYRKFYISQVKHRAVMQLDETGTEAAAATAVVVAKRGMPLTRSFQMLVNRPFLIAVRDRTSGTILFLGSIMDPAQA